MTTTIQLVNTKRGVYWIHPTKLHRTNRLWVGPFSSVPQAMDNARDELKDDIDASIAWPQNDIQFVRDVLLDKLTDAIDDGVQKIVEKRVKAVRVENARIKQVTSDVMRRLNGE